MAETAIELGYDAIVDGDVVDGRELASELIVDAWRLLIPYAKECPACAGQMLAALMGEVIPRQRQNGNGSEKRRRCNSGRLARRNGLKNWRPI